MLSVLPYKVMMLVRINEEELATMLQAVDRVTVVMGLLMPAR